MSATGWPAYRELLRQVARDDVGFRMMKRITWLLVIGALIVVAVTQHFGQLKAGKGMLALFLWGCAHMWCGAFLKSAMAQNRPEYAALVPQLRSRLMHLTAALFIGSSLLLSLLAMLLFGYPGYALLAGGLMSIYTLFTSRYMWLAFSPAVIVLLVAQSGTFDRVASAVRLGLGEPGVAVLGSLLLLALGAWGLRLIFPRAGDAHWAWFRRDLRNKEFTARSVAQLIPSTRFGEWWQARRSGRYQAALRKSIRNGDTPQRMMMYALGANAHPSGHIVSAAGGALCALALLAVADGRLDRHMYVLMGTVLQWSVLMVSLMYVMAVVDGATRYRTEQSIFFLSAGAPARAQINRLLGGAMLRGFFMVWLAALAGVVCIDFLINGQAGMRGATFILAVLLLPLACLLPRNYAVAQAANTSTSWVTLTVLYVIVCNFLMSIANSLTDVPWFWLGAAIAAVSLLELCRRWRKLVLLPPVLPAGRLAT